MTIESIAGLIVTPGFKQVFIPLITALLSIYVKWVSKRNLSWKREDFSVGFDLSIGALFAFLIYVVTISSELLSTNNDAIQKALSAKLMVSPVILLLWVLGLWGISTLIRVKGWEQINRNGVIEDVPTIGIGIVVPIFLGVISLWAVIALGVS